MLGIKYGRLESDYIFWTKSKQLASDKMGFGAAKFNQALASS